jgi:two-component system cell cycle response regulator
MEYPDMPPPARILVIEDNPANLKLMVYLLRAYGYPIESARDGAAGLVMAKTGFFALIVCDVDLPKLDGYGVVRELKCDEKLGRIPIIAVTALAMVGDRDKILAAGFDGYLSKPLDPETFVQQIESFLAPEERSTNRPTTMATSPRAGARPMGGPKKEVTILASRDIPLMSISSTFTGGVERGECLALGAAGFVRRPIGPETLLAGIESAVGFRKGSL